MLENNMCFTPPRIRHETNMADSNMFFPIPVFGGKNVESQGAFQFWMHQIATGQVCGMGGGPPCETFTAARLMEGGPPPLRSGDLPLGFPNLRQRQWQQCLIGSRLIRFLVEALLCLAHTGIYCLTTE